MTEVIVTSSAYPGAETLFKHASEKLKIPITDRQIIIEPLSSVEAEHRAAGLIRYLPPDQILADRPHCDLLLVDEAATLPGPTLSAFNQHYARIAFATTLHGYEGSGRGFALRFSKALQQSSRGLRRIELTQPIRWGENDPLEKSLYELLLLDCELSPVESNTETTTEIKQLDRTELAQNEALLRAVFGLLVQAHYRTRPVDLRHLLDAPGLKLFAQFKREQLVGIAVVSIEGGFGKADTEQIALQIALGQRRPHGHLLPELICAHLGLLAGAELTTARIQRIAIHPDWQGQGLGSQLLDHLKTALQGEVDLLGSSFAADARLVHFWTWVDNLAGLLKGCLDVRLGLFITQLIGRKLRFGFGK